MFKDERITILRIYKSNLYYPDVEGRMGDDNIVVAMSLYPLSVDLRTKRNIRLKRIKYKSFRKRDK